MKDAISNYNFTDGNIEPEDVVRMYVINMGNVGEAYERKIMTVSSIFSSIGGTYYGLLASFLFVDFVFGHPFRDLDIAISFRKL